MLRWTVRLEGGPRRVNHAAVAIGDKIYSFGGYCTGEDYETTRPIDVHVFDTITYRWSVINTPRERPSRGRATHASGNPAGGNHAGGNLPAGVHEDGPHEEGPHEGAPHQGIPHEAGQHEGNPNEAGPHENVPHDGALDDGPAHEGPHQGGAHQGAWRRVVPYQRYGHTCVTWDEKAFIWGGRNDRDGACNVLYCFDPSKAKFSKARGNQQRSSREQAWSRPAVNGHLPGARDGHSACVIRDAMYIFGGYEEEEDRFSNEIHRFCFLTMTWSHVVVSGTPASWRDFHSATPVEDRYMIVFGGRSDYGAPYHTNHEFYCRKVHVFDTKTKRWSQPQTLGETPSGRRSHSAFVHKNLVYIFGGYNGNDDRHYADLWSLDPHAFIWKKLRPRGGMSSLPVSPTSSLSPTESSLPPPVVPDGGGGNAVDVDMDDSDEEGNLVHALAGGAAVVPPTQGHRAPCARRRQCCCVVKDSVILFGGTSPAVEPVEDSEFNLMDHSDLYVLDFYPSLKTLCLISVVDNKLDTTNLPRDLQWDIMSMTTNSNISRPLANNG